MAKRKSPLSSGKPIRVGVVGMSRGHCFAHNACKRLGMELVALCDVWPERLKQAGKAFGVATYTDYDKFLEHDMDAVALANFFHEHAPFAIKALQAGKHVISETMAARTMGQCVDLCEAVEQSGQIYMFAENYPYSRASQELRRLYQAGEIGAVRYAEGEYNHPGEEDWRLSISPGMNHWRNWIPSTYYCSHALAPLMYVTDEIPVSVNALSIIQEPTQSPNNVRVGDAGGIFLVRTGGGAVFRLFGLNIGSAGRTRYEFHGERGLIFTSEPNNWEYVRIHHHDWLRQDGQLLEATYAPDWPDHADMAGSAGHGGGDFWTSFHFANAIRKGRQPYLDVYRGTAMSAVAIQGWRSCLSNGAPQPVPDFKKKSERKPYVGDNWSPFPEDAGPGQPPPSVRGYVKPSPEAIRHARKVWKGIGYAGK